MSVLYKKSANETVSVIPDMNNIDDTQASASTTYSSDKINVLLGEKTAINDTQASNATTFSSNKIIDLISGQPKDLEVIAS